MGHFLPVRQTQDHLLYASLVEQMDDAVGYVLNSLKELGLEENSTVIFTSDNGGVASDDAFVTANLPLRVGEPSSIIRRGNWKLIHYYEDDHDELYDLKTDISETRDLAGSNPQLVRQLHQELFDYLKKVGARFPVADPLYSEDAKNKYLEGVVKNRLPQLEQQRLKFLSKDFYPKNN